MAGRREQEKIQEKVPGQIQDRAAAAFVMPPPTREETVVAKDGLALHVERFVPAAAPRGVVVFVHGFSAHIGNFRHLGRAFADAGLAATLFDCRGHGRSQGRRGYVARFTDYADDLDLILAGARALWPGLPVVLGGHSQGAAICLTYLMGGAAAPLAGLAIAAPYLRLQMKVPAFKLGLAKLTGRLWPTLAMANGVKGELISRTPEVQVGFNRDPLIHHVATPRWFNELRQAQDRIMRDAATLKTPALMQVAGQDRLVSVEAELELARAVGPTMEVKVYADLFHEMFLEPERDEVIGDLVRWVAGRTAISP
jgi:alpha-beta hydrolase superfamily lysophospholipase